MNNRNVWILLASLSAKELRQFDAWLRGELQQRLPEVRRLFEVLKRYHPGPAPLKKMLIQQLSGEKKLTEAAFRKRENALAELLSDFLAIQAFRADRLSRNQYLLHALKDRVDPNTQEKAFRKVKKELEASPHRNAAYYRHTYEYHVAYNHLLIGNTLGSDVIENNEALFRAFDCWWVHNKLALACVNLTASIKHGFQYPSWMNAEIMQQLPDFPSYGFYPLLQLYRELIQLSSTKHSPDQIRKLKESVAKHYEFMDQGERSDFFTNMLNLSILNMRSSNDPAALLTSIDIYEWGIDHQLLLQNGHLPPAHYLNLVLANLKAKDYHRAFRTIEKQGKWLDSRIRGQAVRYATGVYHFYKGEFGQAIVALMSCRFPIPARTALGKIYLWQAWYEQADKGRKWKNERLWLQKKLAYLTSFIKNMSELSLAEKTNFTETLQAFRPLIKANTKETLLELYQSRPAALNQERLDWLQQKTEERLTREFYASAKD